MQYYYRYPIVNLNNVVHGPEKEIIPPGGIFVDPHIFVVWTLAFKNLVVGWKIDAGDGTINSFRWQPKRFLMKDCNALRCHILTIYVFCVYMPADNDVILYNETLCDIQSVFSHYCKMGTVIFAGDFNAQLDTDSRQTPNQKSKLLSSFIKRNRLSPLHQIFNSNAYTYVTARSRIDHILLESSASQMCTKYSVADPHDVITSDHLPIRGVLGKFPDWLCINKMVTFIS